MPGGSNYRAPRGFLTEEEKQHMPKVTWPLLKRILSYLKPYWPQFLLGFVLILVSAVIGLFPSIVTGWIVNEMTGLDKSIAKLVWLLLAAFGALMASQIVSILVSYLNGWISQRRS